MSNPATPNASPRRFNWYLWERYARRPSVNGYSRPISRLEELPDATRQAVEAQLEPHEQPLQIIFAPYQTVLGEQPMVKVKGIRFLPWEYTRDRVIVLTAKRLLAVDLGDDGQMVDVMSAPLGSILYLQSGKILLFSWMEWVWAQGGQVQKLRCYFNTVCEALYANLAEAVRCSLVEPGSPRPLPPDQRREKLSALAYKFRNMLPYYLLDDEQIEQVIFRPSKWERRARFWQVHTLSKAVLMLTDTHLLLAEEELTRSEDAYGLIVTFLPHCRIQGASLTAGSAGLNLTIEIGLAEARVLLDVPVQLELKQKLETLAQVLTPDA